MNQSISLARKGVEFKYCVQNPCKVSEIDSSEATLSGFFDDDFLDRGYNCWATRGLEDLLGLDMC